MDKIEKIIEFSKTKIFYGGQSTTKSFKKFLLPSKKVNQNFLIDVEFISERIEKLHLFLKNRPKEWTVYLIYKQKELDEICSELCKKYSLLKFEKKEFVPGIFTNPQIKNIPEEKTILVFLTPQNTKRVILESKKKGFPAIFFCNSNFNVSRADFILPVNVLHIPSLKFVLSELLVLGL